MPRRFPKRFLVRSCRCMIESHGRRCQWSNWKIYPTYVKSDFDAKAALVENMTAEDVTWRSDERQKEDAVTILKELLECYLLFKPCSASASVLLPFHPSPSARNILLLCCLATITSRSILASTVLNILYTDPAYHRKGAGKMMVQWAMLLPTSSCYPAGSRRHQKATVFTLLADIKMWREYRQTESLALLMDNMVMRRPVKVTKMEGKALEK